MRVDQVSTVLSRPAVLRLWSDARCDCDYNHQRALSAPVEITLPRPIPGTGLRVLFFVVVVGLVLWRLLLADALLELVPRPFERP